MFVAPPLLDQVRVLIAHSRYSVGDIYRPYASTRSVLLARKWVEIRGEPKPGDRDIEQLWNDAYNKPAPVKAVTVEAIPAGESGEVAISEEHPKRRKKERHD